MGGGGGGQAKGQYIPAGTAPRFPTGGQAFTKTTTGLSCAAEIREGNRRLTALGRRLRKSRGWGWACVIVVVILGDNSDSAYRGKNPENKAGSKDGLGGSEEKTITAMYGSVWAWTGRRAGGGGGGLGVRCAWLLVRAGKTGVRLGRTVCSAGAVGAGDWEGRRGGDASAERAPRERAGGITRSIRRKRKKKKKEVKRGRREAGGRFRARRGKKKKEALRPPVGDAKRAARACRFDVTGGLGRRIQGGGGRLIIDKSQGCRTGEGATSARTQKG